MISWATTHSTLRGWSVIGLVFAGIFLWSLMEWVLHRLMHAEIQIAWVQRLQDEGHLRHHREPDDLEHSVARLRSTIPLSILLVLFAWLVLGDLNYALTLISGLLLGYLYYEFVHLASHASPSTPGLRYLRRYHAFHHYADQRRAYGVTSPLWDWVFGSLPRKDLLQTSSTPRRDTHQVHQAR